MCRFDLSLSFPHVFRYVFRRGCRFHLEGVGHFFQPAYHSERILTGKIQRGLKIIPGDLSTTLYLYKNSEDGSGFGSWKYLAFWSLFFFYKKCEYLNLHDTSQLR